MTPIEIFENDLKEAGFIVAFYNYVCKNPIEKEEE